MPSSSSLRQIKQNQLYLDFCGGVWLIDWFAMGSSPYGPDAHRPFVPHNPISAQQSPVPLPKFQMAPRLKIWMSSGSKKGSQIYFPFLSKSPGKRIPSRFPKGAPMERDTRLQGIFTYLFISKAQRKVCPSMFPKSGAPMETDAHSRALLRIPFGVPSKGALPPGPPHGVPSERNVPFLEPSFIHRSKCPVLEPSSWFQFPQGRKGPHWREMSVSGAFLYISSRVPSKGALPRGPPHWASSETDAPSPSTISQSPR